ncbi:sensor histidine kinase [Archangium lansingense]|uniref:histidine kinase n=1 Tax=Archangium lansingense TaxID=2995310 RepID=A0ABT4ANI3_9BACT|nr:GAF domain-containing protein [Archangium lansinium]MCY1083258.1 GAF domain-containing protein [Archangium lansinium]
MGAVERVDSCPGVRVSETRQHSARKTVERLLRLQKVTSKLSQALTPDQVAGVIVQQAGPAMGAIDCTIYLMEEQGLRLVRVEGIPAVDLETWGCLPVDAPVPVAEAARLGEPVWVESLASLRERYPFTHDKQLSNQRAWASLPLEVERRVLGVLTLGFERERGFAEEDRDFACLVARQCAQALERAHLYARERELREQAERARAEAEEHRRLLELEHLRLKAVLQQLPQAVILAEAPSGRMMMGNEQVARLNGGPIPGDWNLEEDLVAVSGFHADGRLYEPHEWPLVRALTQGETIRGEVLDVQRQDGSRLSLSVSAGPVKDTEGRVTAAVALLEDITERLRLEKSLRQGEAVFRRIMESDMMGLAFTDKDGVIHEANAAFLALVGYSRQEMERGALQWGVLVPAEGKDAGRRKQIELLARGVLTAFEMELVRGDGRRVPVLTGAAQVEDLERVISFVLDLTDLKRAEGAVRFLATASRVLGQSLEVSDATLQHVAGLASVSVASWCVIDLVTPEGGLRRAAAAHEDPSREPRLWRAWPTPSMHDSGGPLLQALHSGEPLLFHDFRAETWRQVSSGFVPLEQVMEAGEVCSVMVVPLRSHERVLGLVTLGACRPRGCLCPEDLSMGQELAHRLAAALESSRLFLESQRAVRLRDEFLAVASHELKTPLTPLRLQLQGLRRVVESQVNEPVSPERVLRVVRGCESQVRKLAGLVNDLLDVAKLAQGRLPLHLEEVDLRAVARDVLEQLSAEASRVECRVELGDGSPVVGRWDRLRLEQVVTNLLTNALKYGAGRPVHVRVGWENGLAKLSVRDEGIGIAPEHRGRIFGKFERAVSERHYGGLGLGLHITQQIVSALGGSILLESEVGRGSTFTVELPPDA